MFRIIGTLTRLEAVEDLSYPMAVVMQQFGVLLPAVLYYFVARLFDLQGSPAPATGGDYYSFLVIGLAVAALLQAALSGFGVRLQFTQDRGTFETLLVEPVPWLLIPLALNIWRLLLGTGGAAAILVIGGVLGADYRAAGVLAFAGVLLLGALASSAIGIISASLLVLAKRSTPVLVLYGMAASLFAGTLFPIELIPGWLRWISYSIPHTYVIAASRQLLMLSPPVTSVPVEGAIVGLVVFNVVAFGVGLSLFARSLQYSRRMGLLSGY